MKYLCMDLKVCEGCGVLWLRTGAAGGVYCGSCRGKLSSFPVAKGLRMRTGPRKRAATPRHEAEIQALIVLAGGAH